jgi:hypothetical protein
MTPAQATRAEAEALALAILVETMRSGTPSAKLAAALAVHPRPQPMQATPPADVPDPHGFGVLHVVTEADGTVRPLTDDEVARVRPTDARTQGT